MVFEGMAGQSARATTTRAHYEFAVAVRKDGPDVLTDFSIIEQAINK